MGKKPTVHQLSVANHALLESPIYESHDRGRNWLAVIDVSPTMPSGLSRQWMPQGRGECFYIIEQLKLFDPVEFGADYVTVGGRKHYKRLYGVVVAITDGYIRVEECETGAKAVIRAKEARTSDADKIAALEAERDSLVSRAAKVEAEIAVLKTEGQPEPAPEAEARPS